MSRFPAPIKHRGKPYSNFASDVGFRSSPRQPKYARTKQPLCAWRCVPEFQLPPRDTRKLVVTSAGQMAITLAETNAG